MKWVITLSLILFAVAMPFQRALADNPQPPNFGPLASRIGEWLGKDLEGKPMTVSYQWTGGGTSLVETMAKSNKPLMTMMYHADKGKLMLTHYCKLGTEPRMRVDIPEGDATTLAFTFVDATNLAQPTTRTCTTCHLPSWIVIISPRNGFSARMERNRHIGLNLPV